MVWYLVRMTKSLLAIKCTKNGKSVWAKHPIMVTKYLVGERVTCIHPLFPFFICSSDAISKEGFPIICGAPYDEFNIVQVFACDVSHVMPWVNAVNDKTLRFVSLPDTLDSFRSLYVPRMCSTAERNYHTQHFGAQRLKVVATYSHHDDAARQLKFWSHKLHLPILTTKKYVDLYPERARHMVSA
jgi:hypothetical protein